MGVHFSSGHAELNRMSSMPGDKITKVTHERGTPPGLGSQALKTSLLSEKGEEMQLGGLGTSPRTWQVPPTEWVLSVGLSNEKRSLFEEL